MHPFFHVFFLILTILLLSLSNSTSNLSLGGSWGNRLYWLNLRNKLTPGKAKTTKGRKIPPEEPDDPLSAVEASADELALLFPPLDFDFDIDLLLAVVDDDISMVAQK